MFLTINKKNENFSFKIKVKMLDMLRQVLNLIRFFFQSKENHSFTKHDNYNNIQNFGEYFETVSIASFM